jgi:hypothetical protein
MKGLITFAVIAGILVTAGYFVMGAYLAADPGQLIAFACGNPNEDRQEIQVVVPIAFPMREGPKLSENGVLLWEEWIADHWIITSQDGERIELKRRGAGNLCPDAKIGTPDCFLIGMLKTGTSYTFDFVPSLAEGKRYRREFTLGEAGVPFARENFALIQGS